jgi:hypothetical protein
MGIRDFLGFKTDEEREEELVALKKWAQENQALLESPAFLKAVMDKGGILNARVINAIANDKTALQAIVDERQKAIDTARAKFDEIWGEYEKAQAEVEANPDDPRSWVLLAKAHEKLNNPKEAEMYYRKAKNVHFENSL